MAQPIRDFTYQEIDELFSYHAPTPEQRKIYERINLAFQDCAKAIAPMLPAGPGKTVAIRALSEARMKANQAVALEGKF